MWESNPPCVNAADLQSAVHPLHVPPVKMETHHGLAPCNSYLASNRFESLAYTPLIGTAVIWLLGRGIEDTTCLVPDERPMKGWVRWDFHPHRCKTHCNRLLNLRTLKYLPLGSNQHYPGQSRVSSLFFNYGTKVNRHWILAALSVAAAWKGRDAWLSR